jgi:peptidoglycan/xylan/chitin deacetylase (PgdA/CDA1 family)
MRGTAPTVVLMYHRVASPVRDVHDLCVQPDRFAAQMRHLREREQVVPVGAARRPSRRRRVAVTFDDGYADNAHAAREVLEDLGVPATYFVTARFVDGELTPWWDELERLVFDYAATERRVELVVEGERLTADMGSDPARERAHAALHRRLRRLRRSSIDDVLRQLHEQVTVAGPAPEGDRFMTTAELREVASSRVIDIGCHGMTHEQLSILPEPEQRTEIVEGRARLQRITGRPIETLAYPYGGRDAFDEISVRLAREAGYRLACAGSPGAVRPWSHRFRLPRMVVGDWEVDEFAARLERWFGNRPGSA